MAKVKDQVYDGSEESYTDADGRVHYLGEFLRHTITDGYPLDSTGALEVSRKSPRSRKPTEQGDGSAKQRPWRDCFKDCCNRWAALPEKCPPIGSCPEISSKESVWNAKQAQGVMCSYFDLFLGCCLSACTEISITGPNGVTYTGGVIPEEIGCWPCVSPCKTSTLEIQYYTNRMGYSEQQQLTVLDSEFGGNIPCCQGTEIHWSIESGGGSLSSFIGLSTLYTAPSQNGNCSENPTITLTDCCGRTASLKIGVSNPASDPAVVAFYMYSGAGQDEAIDCCVEIVPECPYPICDPPVEAGQVSTVNVTQWNCFGDIIHTCSGVAGGYSSVCMQQTLWDSCGLSGHTCAYYVGLAGANIDNRTELMKQTGCCPPEF